MRTTFYLSLSLIFLLFSSCSQSDDNTEEITAPEAVDLIFPQNNSECNEGEIINDAESKVTFEWDTALNTEFYVFQLEGLNSDFIYETETDDTEIAVILKRGEAYSWNVTSRSSGSEEAAVSENWYFYNAGPGNIAHVPFPAEILTPKTGKILTSETGKVVLEWSGSDLDDDISSYEVYFGQENPPVNKTIAGLETILEVNITSATKYFWFVITIDEQNNSSKSNMVNFEVE